MSSLFRDDIDTPHITTLDGLRHSLSTSIVKPALPTVDEYRNLTPFARTQFDEARARYSTGGFRVKTPLGEETVKLFRQTLRANLYAPNRTGLMIDGAGHMGKTTLCQYLMDWTYRKYISDFPNSAEDGTVPIVYVEARPRSNGKSLMRALCDFFGRPVPNRYNTDQLTAEVIDLLRKAKTQLVVIDEFQNIAAKNPGNGETVDYIKELTNEVKATFIISGIHVLRSEILAGARGNQLSSRFIRQEITPYTLANEDEKLRWQQLLLGFERELPLLAQKPKSILAHADELHRATKGSIGALSKLLARTTVDLIYDAEPDAELFTKGMFLGQRRDVTSESINYLGGTHAA
ncbi:TniB family NTP-binding protein [Leifsonia shinshuensis]|uniref:AAA family ATPase n=1 Tax=Leifsonia shinshuensis TaxID=150026 RepID=A0A7G6YAA7_9MICO|nr:TniB family NTP-binding protein [Leifsonia shinshuensis]QNE35422.1 AAA family ATPase [Leifsonia shinshuensis]